MPAKKRKTWSGRVYLGCDDNGRQRFWWVGRFATRRERDDAVAKVRIDKPWDIAVAPDELSGDLWADSYLSRMESGKLLTRGGRHYKRSSVDTARTCLRAFRAEFGDRPIGAITRPEAIDWKDRVTASKLPVVITLFELAVSEERISRNPFRGLSRRVDGRRNDHPPTEDEMVLLLDGCGALGAPYAPMMRSLLTFAAFSGLRPGELMALEWDDIDLGASRVRVERRLYRGSLDLPKSNRARTVALVPQARGALQALRTMPGYIDRPLVDGRDLVFRSKKGGRLCAPLLTDYWGKVRARARLDCDFYLATKHYCVHHLKVVKGLPDAAIAAQMGWSERSIAKMVETYGHAVDERRLDEIDAAFAEAKIERVA